MADLRSPAGERESWISDQPTVRGNFESLYDTFFFFSLLILCSVFGDIISFTETFRPVFHFIKSFLYLRLQCFSSTTLSSPTMSTAEANFSAPPEVLTFDGLLFDFDGTIIDSTDG